MFRDDLEAKRVLWGLLTWAREPPIAAAYKPQTTNDRWWSEIKDDQDFLYSKNHIKKIITWTVRYNVF